MRDRKVSWPEYQNKEANLFALIMDIREEREEEKEKIYEKTLDRFTGKVLTCDQCGAQDSNENEVREWGNPYDWGVICEECDCHET
jgi:hypothetical protein|tara:strand:+ start:287 stop:544 length:258 start_codon:yes stop_codon:yes gene_type:complete